MLWLIHYLPESIILLVTSIILGLGFAITILSWATKYLGNTFLLMYRLPIQVVGNLLLVLGVYFHGGYRIEMEWRARVDEAQRKIQEYESRVPEVNERVVVKYKTKVQVVERKVVDNKKHNTSHETAINQDCTLSDSAIESYNRAVSRPTAEEGK